MIVNVRLKRVYLYTMLRLLDKLFQNVYAIAMNLVICAWNVGAQDVLCVLSYEHNCHLV